MADTIDNIVSQEVFEQLSQLRDSLAECDTQLKQSIGNVSNFTKELSNATNVREVGTAYNNLSSSVENLSRSQSNFNNTAIQIRNVVSQVSKGVTDLANSYRVGDSAIEECGKNQQTLSRLMMEQQIAIQNTKSSMSELTKNYKEQTLTLGEYQKRKDALASQLSNEEISIESYQDKLSKLDSQYESQNKNTDEYNRKMAELKISLAELQAQFSNSAVLFKAQARDVSELDGSISGLQERASLLKNVWNQLNETQRNDQNIGGLLKEEYGAVTQKLRELNQEMGKSGMPRFRTIVMAGKNEIMQYAFQIQSLTKDLDVQKQKSEEIARVKGVESEEYRASQQAIGQAETEIAKLNVLYEQSREKTLEYQKVMRGVNMQMSALSSPTANIQAMTQGVGLLANSFTVLKASTSALGIENKAVVETLAKVMLIQQGLNAVNAIATTLNKNSIFILKSKALIQKMHIVYLKALAKERIKNNVATQTEVAVGEKAAVAEGAQTAATGALTVAEGAATATTFSLIGALEALKAAFYSLPLVGQILAIVAAVAAIVTLIFKAARHEDAAAKSERERLQYLSKRKRELEEIDEKVRKENENLREQIELFKQGSLSASGIDDMMDSIAQKTGISVDYLKEHTDEIESIAENYEQYNASIEKEKKLQEDIQEIEDKRRSIIEEIESISSLEKNSRREGLEEIQEEYGLQDNQRKKILKYMRQYNKGKIDEKELEEKVGVILDKTVDMNEEVKQKLLDQLNVQKDNSKEVKNRIDKTKELATAEMRAKTEMRKAQDLQLQAEQAWASATQNSTMGLNAQIKSINYSYERQNEELEKTIKNEQEKLIAISFTRGAVSNEYKEQKKVVDALNKQKTALKELNRAQIADANRQAGERWAQVATERFNAEKEAFIAEKKYELQMTRDVEKKKSLYAEIQNAEFEKKKREIEKQNNIKKEVKDRQIANARNEMELAIAKYNNDLDRLVAERLLKQIKGRVDALTSYKQEMLNSLTQGTQDWYDLSIRMEKERYENTKSTMEEAMRQEVLLLAQTEEEKAKILDDYSSINLEYVSRNLNNFFNSKEEEEAFIEKWRIKDETNEKQHQNNIEGITRERMNGVIGAIEKFYDNEKNRLTIEFGVKTTQQDKDEYDSRQSELEIESINKRIEAYQKERDALDNVKLGNKKYLEETKRIDGEINALAAERTRIEEKEVQKRIKALEEEREARIELYKAIGSAISDLGSAFAQFAKDEIRQVKIEQYTAMAQVMIEQGVAIAKAITSVLRDKSNVTWYETAAKIVAAIATVASTMATAISAIQQANTSISEAEAYAEGTDYHKGGAAVIGEGGSPELVMTGGKSFVVDKPTFFPNLPVGAKVVPLNGSSDDLTMSAILNSVDDIKNRSIVRIDVGENVYTHIVKGASRTRIINRQFSH